VEQTTFDDLTVNNTLTVGSSDSEHSAHLNVYGKVEARRGSFDNLSVHSDASFHGDVSVHGNMSVHDILTAYGYNFRMGSDRTGSAQLSSGTVTVSTGVTCSPSSSVLITIQTPSSEGFYSVIVGSNAFTINSSNGTDASLVNWIVFN
jgi:hypothetical protein